MPRPSLLEGTQRRHRIGIMVKNGEKKEVLYYRQPLPNDGKTQPREKEHEENRNTLIQKGAFPMQLDILSGPIERPSTRRRPPV